MPTILSKPAVSEALFRLGIDIGRATVILQDERYCLASREWLAGDFCDELREEIKKYDTESWDCDDFARHAWDTAAELHAATPGRPENCALACGMFSYMRRDGRGHVIFWALTAVDSRLELVFIEPQLAAVVELTRQEIESCALLLG